MGLLPQSVKSCLTGKWKAAEHVGDDLMIGYDLKRVPPEADVITASAIVAEALAPAGKPAALKELTMLRLVTRDQRNLSHDELKLMLAAYAERCAAFPADVITAACQNAPYWEFWPALGKLLERMEALIEQRRRLQRALTPEAIEGARERARIVAEAQDQRRAEILAVEREREQRFQEAAEWRRDNPGPYNHAYPTMKSEPEPVTAKVLKRVRKETDGFKFLAEDDPRVQARLREMGAL
jgi:hypothetical protein